MTDSRQKIFAKIKQVAVPPVQKPSLDFTKLTFANHLEKFCQAVESVGGTSQVVSKDFDIKQFCQIPAEAKMISALAAFIDQNIDRAEIKSAHDMQNIDFCCFHAQLGVAENGALLTYTDDFPFRSVYFLTQHLIVTVNANTICNNMHEAYEHIKANPFFAFISGPSKTADIEQCLVIGAHGARSLRVFVVE